MPLKLTLHSENKITIFQHSCGVEIREIDIMDGDSSVVISYDRLEKVIACLHQIHMKRQNKEWRE